MSAEWIGIYKLVRLGILAVSLVGIAIWAYSGDRRERLEEPARRMLEEDDA